MKVRFLLTVIVLAFACSLVNGEILSNTFVVDDIEYYMQVNNSSYIFGENVEMLFRVTNLRAEDVIIYCSRSPEFDFRVEGDAETVWSQRKFWLWHSPGVAILAGEFEERVYTWDMTGDDGNPVDIGTYNVVGVMYNEMWNDSNYGNYVPTEVGVAITITPEPCTLVLFAVGMTIFMRKRI